MLPHRLRLVALAAMLAASGCRADSPPQGTTLAPDQTAVLGDGRILVAWTLAGQPPSPSTCAAIDHLTLGLTYRSADYVIIEPIPCALTRFRFDGLPEGAATVEVAALDGRGCAVTGAGAALTVSPTLPADPSPVLGLPGPRACR